MTTKTKRLWYVNLGISLENHPDNWEARNLVNELKYAGIKARTNYSAYVAHRGVEVREDHLKKAISFFVKEAKASKWSRDTYRWYVEHAKEAKKEWRQNSWLRAS